MPKLSPQQLKSKYDKNNTHKDNWRSIYEDAYRYSLPMRNLHDGYYDGDVPGQDKMSRVFDSTAIDSTQKFANRLQSGLFPPAARWCRLIPGSEIPEERKIETQQILDSYADRMFDIMRQSNFDQAMGEFLLELAIGTAVMLIQPGDEVTPIRYTAVPTFLITFEEGPFGTVDKVYRRMKRPYGVLDQEFPDIKIPQDMKQKYTNREGEMVELIEGTYYDKNTGRYHYQIIDRGGQNELVYRDLKSFPWVIARYMKAANERYGRGPVLTALPDIKTLNRVLELTLKNASLTIAGVYTAVDTGVINPNSINLVPGAIIPVNSNGGPRGADLQPLPRSGDPQLSQIITDDLRMNIKKILLDESLPPDNMSARTALEVAERMKQLSQNLGSAYGRLINETMYPVVKRTLEVMDGLGIIQLPLKVNGLQVKIQPVGEIAMASNMTKVNQIMQYIQIASSLGPTGQMTFKIEEVADFIADAMAVPAAIRTTFEERQQMQQVMAEQAQALAQQQMQQGMMNETQQQAATNDQ